MDFTKIWLHQENYPVFKQKQSSNRSPKSLKWFLLSTLLLVFLVGCRGPQTVGYQDPASVTYELGGNISDEEEANQALEVIEKNLKAVSDGDLDLYLETIISEGVEETKDELEASFNQLDLEVTILRAEVMEQEEERMLIQVYQQTVAENTGDAESEYRDHVAEANYTMVQENNEWKIEETVMTNNQFIDYTE